MKDETAPGFTSPPRGSDPNRTHAVMAPALAPELTYFGNYDLVAELGRGGMGVVYRARQRNLDRLVALKMVLSGRFAGAREVQRFKAEAEAAAALDHSHIVPIYEVGQHEGWYYYSMKLIEGGDLAQRIGEFRDNPRAAARFMVKVARAIHHAHQRGILHRDIKPSNILLDVDGEPYIADLGLAKHLSGEAKLTQSEAVLGTPAYMAPEQASGRSREATTASDIYSLGAVMYEMVSGRPPFRADSASDLLQQLREKEAPSLRSINARVDRDLETICLKCLSKDPAGRYDSAGALADDLDRWLRHEPILARPSSMREQVVKFIRRHRAMVAGLLLVTGILVGGIISTTRQAIRATRAEKEMTRQRNESIAARAVADASRAKAERRLTEVWQLAEALLFDVHNTLERSGPTAAREKLAEVAMARLDALDAELRSEGRQDPEVLVRLAAALEKVADVQGHPGAPNLGNTTSAIATYRRAIGVAESLLALDDGRVMKTRSNLFRLRGKVGDLLQAQGRALEAAGEYRAAMEYGRLAQRAFPDNEELQLELARIGMLAATLSTASHEPQKRLRETSSFIDALKTIAGAYPRSTGPRKRLARGLVDLSKAQIAAHDRPAALATAQQALELADQLLAIEQDDAANTISRAMALRQLGLATADLSLNNPPEADKALQLHRDSVNLLHKLAQSDPRDVMAAGELLRGYEAVGALYDSLKKLDDARAIYHAGIRLAAGQLQRDPRNATALGSLRVFYDAAAVQLLMQQDFDGAIAHHEKAIETGQKLLAMDPRHAYYRYYVAYSRQRLALALLAKDQYRHTGETAKAIEHLEQSTRDTLPILEELKGAQPQFVHNLAVSHYLLANGYLVLVSRKPPEDEARKLFTKARDSFRAGIKAIDDFTAQRPEVPLNFDGPTDLRNTLVRGVLICENGMKDPGGIELRQEKLSPPP